MNILVTGATGFIGLNLVNNLAKKHDVRCLIHNPLNDHFLKESDCEIFYGDVTNKRDLEKCFKDVEVVYHLACQMKGENVAKKAYWDVNVEGTKNVVEKSIEENVEQLIFSGTASGLLIKDEKPVDENYEIYDKSNDYKITKTEAEKIVLSSKDKLNVTVISTDFVFGPYDIKGLGYFRLPLKKTIITFNHGRNSIQPVYVEDVIQGMVSSLNNKKAFSEKIFISSEKNITSMEFLKQIALQLNTHPRFVNLPIVMAKARLNFLKISHRNQAMQSYIDFFTLNHIYNINKAQKLLGYKPKYNIEKLIKSSLEWYRNNDYL